MLLRVSSVATFVLLALPMGADPLGLPITIETARGPVVVELAADGAATSPALPDCLPDCLLPAQVADGVANVGEREVLAFLTGPVAAGEGLLIDPRLPEAFAAGALPGAINLPALTLQPENPYLADVLRALGAVAIDGSGFDFAQAKNLLINGNGPWEDEGAAMVRTLIEIGYPSEKLKFYRGGLRDWAQSGLGLVTSPVQG